MTPSADTIGGSGPGWRRLKWRGLAVLTIAFPEHLRWRWVKQPPAILIESPRGRRWRLKTAAGLWIRPVLEQDDHGS